ncbi:YczE/YyaS/YitT family protein [Mesobacillus zeae]|nr:YitT family protein [Mesobacillus zeae]
MVLFYRILFFITGITVLGLGISLSIKSGLGSGAWDALNVGLANTIGLTPGTWVVIVGILLIIINSFLLKKRPEITAIITLFLIGAVIDFWLMKALLNLAPQTWTDKILVLLAGILTMGIGLSIYIPAKFPLSPIDNLMIALRERLGVSLMTAKTIGEIIAFSAAWLLNGPIGIGTVIVTFSIGPLIQVFFPYTEKLLKSLTGHTW